MLKPFAGAFVSEASETSQVMRSLRAGEPVQARAWRLYGRCVMRRDGCKECGDGVVTQLFCESEKKEKLASEHKGSDPRTGTLEDRRQCGVSSDEIDPWRRR